MGEPLEDRLMLAGAPPSTPGLYDPARGLFLLRNSNTTGGADAKFAFSSSGGNVVPRAGDFNGDGLDTVGLYDAEAGVVHLRNENSAAAAPISFPIGDAGMSYQPMAGDWNGDGVDTIGLFRPDTGAFLLRNANSAGAAELFQVDIFGADWKAIAGDWNGDGIDTVGLYDPARREFHLLSANSAGAAEQVFAFGPAGVQPLAGDWNGDGIDTIGVYDRVRNRFSLRNRNSAGNAEISFTFGKSSPGWTAVTGNWKTSAAIAKNGVYTVPGKPDQLVTSTFTWVSRSAAFENEVGIFPVDDSQGRIGALRPGDKGYAAAALSRAGRNVLFTSGQGAGAQTTLELAGGTRYAMYLIENSSSSRWLARNPQNAISRTPRAYFSLLRANPDRVAHFRSLAPNRFAWEDSKYGGDRDFNDVVGRIDYEIQVGSDDAQPPNVIIENPLPGALTNQSPIVRGRITDNESGALRAQASIGGGDFFDVPVGAGGSFEFVADVPTDGSADGRHTFIVRAIDSAGNVSSDVERSFVLDTIPPPLSVELAPESDRGALGDGITTEALVQLVGQSEPGAQVTLNAGSAQTVADAWGRFQFDQVPLELGPNAIQATASDAAGNQTLFSTIVTRGACGIESLAGWKVEESGGSPAGRGSVAVADCQAVLAEGDSFLVSLSRSLTIPDMPSVLEIALGDVALDTSDPDFVKDAFEVALVDEQGFSLLPTFLPGRDALVNFTEGLPALAAAGTQIAGNTILVDLAGIAPGTVAELILRLASDDDDTQGQTAINRVIVRDATPAEQSAPDAPPAALSNIQAASSIVDLAQLDLSRMADITASFSDLYFRTSFDERQQTLFVEVATRNDGTFESRFPLLVAVTNISEPTVRVRDADGQTPSGAPLFDLSRQLGAGSFLPGDTSAPRPLSFFNPDGIPFTFDLTFYGLLNQPPEFLSAADQEALVGQEYFYQVLANDPDGDPLTFALIAAAGGMTIDPAMGRIAFTPTASDLGTHTVTVVIEDGRGGAAEQTFFLTVDSDVPNRPPVLITSPNVDGNVHTLYAYDVDALDDDGDPLAFSLVIAPVGMEIDAGTGAIAWTPTADQLDASLVMVSVSDGRGGTAEQSFIIVVQQAAGNHAPIIISEPIAAAVAGSLFEYQVRALDPDGDELTFALAAAPAGAAIDSQLGLVTFTAVTGAHAFEVRVTDGRGGWDTQSFQVTVDDNHPPVITSTPVTEFTIPPGESSPPSGDVDPATINLMLEDGQTQTVAVRLDFPPAGSLVPSADVFLLFDDTGSFTGTAPAVVSQFESIIGQLQAALPEVHFGFGVGRFEDYANVTATNDDRPFILNQPIIATDVAGFQDAIRRALATRGVGLGGDTPEALIEALFQTATGLGLDGNGDGDTTDSGLAGTISAQVVLNASGDVPSFDTIDDPVSFRLRMLDVANVPVLPLDTTITRTMNPGSLNDVFQFQGSAGQRLFFDTLAVQAHQPVRVFASPLSVKSPRWSIFDSRNVVIARSDLTEVGTDGVSQQLIDKELVLPSDDTYVLFVENTDVESVLEYSFRLMTPETSVVPYVLGTFISGSIGEARERDEYRFTLASPTRLVIDPVTPNFGVFPFTWTLEGPQGIFARDRQFNDAHTLIPEQPPRKLPAGDYRLTIGGVVDTVGDYQFRLSDLEGALPIALDTVVETTINLPMESQLFRFHADAGDQIFLDRVSGAGGQATLIDPHGLFVFQRVGGDVDVTTLPVAGMYTLLLERTDFSAGFYRFVVNDVAQPAAQPIALGELVTASTEKAGETNVYSFTLAAATDIYFDVLSASVPFGRYDLTDSFGHHWLSDFLDRDSRVQVRPLLHLPAGDYRLTIDPADDSLAIYSLRISDFVTAPLLAYSVPAAGTLPGGSESDFFALVGTAGDQVIFSVSSDNVQGGWRLLGPTGVVFDRSNILGSDTTTVTLPDTGTYRLFLEGRGIGNPSYSLQADLLGNSPSPPVGQTLDLGNSIDGTIGTPGQVDTYRFTLASDRLVAFDALAGDLHINWSLTGTGGSEVQNRSFILSDGRFAASPHVLRLQAGTYLLTITANGGHADPYRFRLLDLETATPVPIGAPVSGEINPPTETDMLRLDVSTPGRFFIDNQSPLPGGSDIVPLVVVDPFGFIVSTSVFLQAGVSVDGEVELKIPGSYTLLLEGESPSQDPHAYQFTVTLLPAAPPTPLILGEQIDAAISLPGETDQFTFTLSQETAIYFDAQTFDSNLRYTLSGPTGVIVNFKPFSELETIFRFIPPPNPFSAVAGEYALSIEALGDSTPAYSFRVLDVAEATPAALDTFIAGTIDPAGSAALFRIDIPSAGIYFFDNRSPAGTEPGRRNIWRLYDTFGQVAFSSDFVVGTQLVLDAEVTLSSPGSYTLLIEPEIRNESPLPFEFLVRQTSSSAIPLSFSAPTFGSLDQPGDTVRYSFTLPTDDSFHFDAQTNDPALLWSLAGPEGIVISPRPFTDSDAFVQVRTFRTVQNLVAGDYVLTIDGVGDRVGPFAFQLHDFQDATPITLGTPFSGLLSPANVSRLYQFQANAGDIVLLDSIEPSASEALYHLVDPYGELIVTSTDLQTPNFNAFPFLGQDTGPLQLLRTGTYTLIFQGAVNALAETAYTFNVVPIADSHLSPPVTEALTLDGLVDGSLDDLRSARIYTFSGVVGQRLLFDGIESDSGGMTYRLIAPSGAEVFDSTSRPEERVQDILLGGAFRHLLSLPIANRSPFTLPETGTYHFVVDAAADSIGRVLPQGVLGGAGFRSGSFPIVLVATDTGTAFQPDGIDPVVGVSGVSVPASDFLSQSRASTPQGRGASIQQAISALSSLGAVVIGMGTNADAAAAPRRTLEAIARLTGGVNASDSTFSNNTADPISPGDPFYYQIQADNGASTAEGITAAILQSLQNLSFDVDIVPSDPSVVIENLSGIRSGIGAGESAQFEVRFSGDGQPRSFDLLFVRAGTGVILGSIPVRINADPYVYDVEASDPDGDALAFALVDAPAGASIDLQTGVINFVPTGPGLFPFTVEVNDGQGGTASQSYFVTVSDGQPNQPPAITSSPGATALVGQSYAYQVAASDPDGDSLSFFLLEAPAGMEVDSATGGISWTPTAAQLGARDVTVRVLDAHGGAATQSFQVTVVRDSVQVAPRIVSTPPTAAEVGRLFRYDVSAIDPNLDPLEFDLPARPDGMAIDSQEGTIVWRPTLDQLGRQDAIVRVRDGRGGVRLQAFQILVSRANTAPVITSRPGGVATAGLPFVYQLGAQDAEDEALAYSLRGGLAGMTIDPLTGLFSWTPTIAQLGSALVTLVAADPLGAEDVQDVLITVNSTSANVPPSIESVPRLRTGLQNFYLYQVRARDPNGDPLAYLLAGPQGMTIDAAGVVTWQPAPGQLGLHSVSIEVSDGRSGVARQDFSLEVVNRPVNSPPEIVSAPPTSATIGAPFAYDPAAVDADNDPLFWSLDETPLGVSIDPHLGSIRWTPTADQRGPQTVVLRVTDPLGGSSTQSLALEVRGANVPPVFATSPVTRAAVDQFYRYAPRAVDGDGDIPTFSLAAAPLGMTIDGASGVIDWTPAADQLGVHDVTLVVRDGQGSLTRQLYRILVAESFNRAPEITSTPPTAASVGFSYEYDVDVIDPDGDEMSLAVLDAPLGMIIDSATGLIGWVPQPGQEGPHTITVQAQDSLGALALQTFTIDTIADNGSPVLAGTPRTTAAAGQLYRFDVPASDPDGDPLTYQLDLGPAGMSIDQLGRILWQTTAADVGDHPVQITISDNRGAQVELAYEIAVRIDAQAPRVSIGVSENPASIGSQVVFQVRATDDVGVESVSLTIGGIPMALDRSGRGTFLADQAGPMDVVATATDGAGNVATAELELLVRDPSDPNAPTTEIISPSDDTVVTTFTDIIGTVNDDNLLLYTVEIAPADGDFTEIARGTSPVIDGVLGRFDPTLLANDTYTLRLTAVDTAGNVSVDETSVSVRGNLKIGEFSLSFIDINVPVLGVPIIVARTYSSFDAAREQSLGFGWRLSVQDVDLRTNVPKTGDEQDGIFNPFFQNARVYVTLPGGRREGFTFKPKARFGFADLTLFRPEFVPDKGVTSQLTVDPYDLIATRSGEFFGMMVGGLPYNPADSAFGGKYVLTTKGGLKYEIDGISGDLRRVTTPSGETLTYLPDQIASSAGLTVAIGRDQRGRITSVTDPNGHTVRYGYDAAGDLLEVTDQAGNQTNFEYSTARPHFLERVIDPLGRTGIRVEYDAEGRIVRHFDAAGHEIEFVNDFANSQQTIVDARDNPTTYEYDDRGNVLTTIDPLGGITRRTYDDNDYELTTTDPLGHTTTRTFDARGNVLSEADPLGNTSRTTYNGFGDMLTSTDPLGNTTTTTYTKSGNDIRSIDFPDGTSLSAFSPDGTFVLVNDGFGIARFDVDRAGNTAREVDPLGGERAYTYDANGNVLTETVFRTIGSVRRALTTTFEYDAENRLVVTRDPLGNVSRSEYDAAGQEIARIDALGRQTTYEYDVRGLLVRMRFPDGATVENAYDEAGNKIRVVDQAGRTTNYEYDLLNRLVTTVFPDETPADLADNPRQKAVYDAAGRKVATIDENLHRTEYEYDAASRRIRTILPAAFDGTGGTQNQPVIQEDYDAAGNLTTRVDANGNRSEYEHDEMGRITLTRFADGSEARKEYDAAGRLVAKIDQAGQTIEYAYDAVGNLLSVALPAPAAGQLPLVTHYTYDEAGNRLTHTDALGRSTTHQYDELNRLVRRERPSGASESFAYDAMGNQIRHADFNGATTQFTYDVQNRLVRKEYPDSTFVATTYTLTGLVATQADSRGLTQYAYDERDRLLSRTEPDGRSIAYTYDDVGNRLSVASPAGATSYLYDALNRLIAVTDSRGGLTEYEYDLAGNLLRTELPNGTVESRVYDALNRATSVVHAGPAGAIASFLYTFDPVGRRTRVLEHDGRSVDYAYDLTGRLVGEALAKPGTPTRTIDYLYDAVGNRLSRSDSAGGQTVYQYDVNDQLLSETSGGSVTTYIYDTNGNTLSITSPTEQRTFSWDAENRLIGLVVTDANGTRNVEYEYNAGGLRVSQAIDGHETRYLVDELLGFGEVLEEYESDGTTLTAYTYGADLIAQERADQTLYFLTDGLGHTRVLTDADTEAIDSYFFDAYGRVAEQSGSVTNSHLYRGEEFDQEAAAYYLRARYYNPDNGRFLTTDPFAGMPNSPMSLHRYIFANADPVTFQDPSGLNNDLGSLQEAQASQYQLQVAQSVTERTIIEGTRNRLASSIGNGIANGVSRRITREYARELLHAVSNLPRNSPLARQIMQEYARPIINALERFSPKTQEVILNTARQAVARSTQLLPEESQFIQFLIDFVEGVVLL